MDNQKERVIEALASFVIRATKENATPDEIEILPSVAKVLLSYLPESGSH